GGRGRVGRGGGGRWGGGGPRRPGRARQSWDSGEGATTPAGPLPPDDRTRTASRSGVGREVERLRYGRTRIFAWRSGEPRSTKAWATLSSPTSPVMRGAAGISPFAR